MTQIYYLIRSKIDGSYLAAHPKVSAPEGKSQSGYLLMFKENFDALSYLNKYAGDMRDRFAVESIVNSQFKGIMQRWGFAGVGMVEDPLIPRIQFLASSFW